MKKLIYAGNFLTILSFVLLSGCKKDSKVAFPTQSSSNGTYSNYVFIASSAPKLGDADGILVAAHVHNYHILTISPVLNEFQYGIAKFTNSTGNFSVLTDAGSVSVDSANCVKSSDYSYLSSISTYSLDFGGNNVAWNVTGAGSVPAMTYTMTNNDPTYTYFNPNINTGLTNYWNDAWIPTYPRTLMPVTRKPTTGIAPPWPNNPNPPVPTHNDTVLWYGITAPQANHTDSTRWLSDSATFHAASDAYRLSLAKRISDSTFNVSPFASIPIQSYVTNADTVTVIFNDGVGFYFEKRVAATSVSCDLKPNDFLGYPTFSQINATLQINLTSYTSTTVAGKKYYFIRMGSYVKYWKPG